MDPDSSANLPFGIVKEVGATRYIICIDSAEYRNNSASMSAYMAMEFPGSQQMLCFSAQNIAFNPRGVMPGPNTKLVLVSEHRIALGPKITMVLKPDGFNYVEWDCNGFTAVNLKGYFEFDPGMIYPDPDNIQPDSVVRASFQIHTNDIHNMVVQASIAPFCIRGLEGLSFSALDATADFSELSNAPNMVFPNGYSLAPYNGIPQMWTGFYMRNFTVKLPQEMARNGQRPLIMATNLLIDQSGVSGLFSASNLFNTNQGSMSGWGFSVNTIGVNIVSNHLNGASAAGYVKLPVSENDSLAYACVLTQNLQTGKLDYAFAITPASNIEANVIGGKLTLYNTTTIAVTKQNGKLRPQANINGKFSLTNSNARITNLEFQNMVIVTEAPLLRSATFALVPENPDSNKLAGFQFTISGVQVGALNNESAISFTAGVNFSDGNALSIGAAAGFVIKTVTATVANPAEGAGATKPKMIFDGVSINSISLAFNSGPFDLNGTILFRDNDPVYGKGFYGNIQFTIDKVMSAPAVASVWFGRVNGMRYFYVDAAVPITVPIVGTNMAIYRFMGGIYYHMSRQSNQSFESQLYTSVFGNAQQYVPDANTGLGIKAGVTLGSYPSERPVNGDVALEIAFNSNGGMSYINFTGNVFFMTAINQRLSVNPNTVPIVASMVMQYDFQNDALHAALGAQVHLPGVNGNGMATFHFEPGLWYIHIGRPQQRINISVYNIGNFTAYFETGLQIDPMPAPPPQVTSVVNMNGLYDQRDENALNAGSGVAFGAAFSCGMGGQFMIGDFGIYYNVAAGAGFDIMVLNYGPNAHCQNSASVVGINGWYATGQLYAYLQGAVGITGEVSNQTFNVTILNLSAAAILQARLPNPAWVGGSVGCDYDILGGLVSGHVDCSFQAGNQCTIVQQ